MELRTGTSGYSYKEWKGPFYPEKLPAREMLAFYAEQLGAVEINNTFYRLPRANVLEGWREQVPESFRFVLKASRRITHFKRLKEAGDETGYLLETAATLGERLGAILFQTPPNLALDLPRLEGFVKLLPEGTRAAFEFRHASWFDASVEDLLRERNLAWCSVDAAGDGSDDVTGAPSADEALPRTADWGYLRLRRPGYERDELSAWAERIGEMPWSESFVFFKHEDAGAGPKLAQAFATLFERSRARREPRRASPRRSGGARERGA